MSTTDELPEKPKGASCIGAVSPHGERLEVKGVCLVVRRKNESKNHHTIHELGVHGAYDAIVAIVPDSWVLLLSRNQ